MPKSKYEEEYLDGFSLREIAERHGVSHQAVHSNLKRHGVELRLPGNGVDTQEEIEERNRRIRKEVKSGKKPESIAGGYGLSPATIRKIVSE